MATVNNGNRNTKISAYITEKDSKTWKLTASRENKTISDLIRDAVNHWIRARQEK